LLHPRFFELAEYIREQGFAVGMTTNGVLITQEVARHMADIGIRYITLSLDGLEESHDKFRQRKGCWKKTIDAIDNLNVAGVTPSITTVANALNIDELEDVYKLLQSKGVKLWRVLNVDPIGRAMEHPELLLDGLGYQQMIWFIEDKRINHSKEMPQLTSSCAHYLGPIHEGETRNWIFSCRAGTTVASVTAKGEFLGCLDVERIPKLIMGQLGKDSFVDIWENSYKPYRESRVPLCSLCMECEHKYYCDGDSMHTWNFDLDQPKLCIGAR
jgi:radical SAM protein with 4Fe4S-binding SPASM domain